MLTGDTPVAPNPNTDTVEQIRNSSATSGDALVNLFTTTELPGDSAEERFEVILDATESGSGQNFAVNFGQSGLQDQFVDPFPDSSYQVEHFLTASNLAYSSGNSSVNEYINLSLVTGHEMEGDQGFPFAQHVVQGLLGMFNREAHNAFLNGTDEDFSYILGLGSNNPNYRYGNSIEDLRLSRLGWDFGRRMFNREFGSRDDAANWLRKNLLK
jgi:hypothetical protein